MFEKKLCLEKMCEFSDLKRMDMRKIGDAKVFQ